MPFQIPLTGRLIDAFGSGISGAQVFFTSKATSRGDENVAKTVGSYFLTDPSGYYSTSLASGWYKIDILKPGALDVERLGVATVSGVDSLDLGTLIDNSIPPPTLLENISNVQRSGLANGYVLAYNTARQKWVPTAMSGSASAGGGGSGDAEATGALLNAKINSVSGWAASAANLTATGAALRAQLTGVSGALFAQINAAAAGVSTLNSRSGVLSIVGTGSVTVSTAGQTIIVSGVSGAAGITQGQLDAVSGFFLTPPQFNLNGGTSLAINAAYYDGFAANRTITFAGSPSPGSFVTLRANVTGRTVLQFPTSYRIADSGTITGLTFTPGSHEASWAYADSKWWLADSSSDGIGSTITGLNGQTGAVSIVGAGSVAVTTAAGVLTISGTATGGGATVGQDQLSPGFVYATGGLVTLTADNTKTAQNLAITATGNVILRVNGTWDGCGGLVTVFKTYAGTGSLTIPSSGYIVNGLGATVVPLSYGASGYDTAAFAYHKAGSLWAVSTLSGFASGELTAAMLTATGQTLGAKVDSVSGWAASAVNLTATGASLIARDNAISGVQTVNMSPPFAVTSGQAVTFTIDPSRAIQNLKLIATGGNTTLTINGAYNGANGVLIVDRRATGAASIFIPSGSVIFNGPTGMTGLSLTSGSLGYDAFSFAHDGDRYYWAASTAR